MSKGALKGADSCVIEYVHWKIHDGQMYNVYSVNTDVTATGYHEIFINVGSKDCHLSGGVNAGDAARVQFYEGVTTSANGTTVTAYNMDRESSNSNTTAFYHTPTWSTNSEVIIDDETFGAATNRANPIGGSVRRNSEWELSPNTKYVVRITNNGAATTTVSFNAQFYELD